MITEEIISYQICNNPACQHDTEDPFLVNVIVICKSGRVQRSSIRIDVLENQGVGTIWYYYKKLLEARRIKEEKCDKTLGKCKDYKNGVEDCAIYKSIMWALENLPGRIKEIEENSQRLLETTGERLHWLRKDDTPDSAVAPQTASETIETPAQRRVRSAGRPMAPAK